MTYVGIVLISHSPKIVEGVKELIRQVIHDVPIELAGGTEENEIGTSMDKIADAIKAADRGKGVILFYDIGSAKMNAEMAIEITEMKAVLIEAPLVEGSYVAAVESGMGKSLEEVINAVEKAF
ncbi:PTS-dependent dihydroxyacetone kinase phosphotransferase subunit DhaM [Oceanobacillus sp. 143]|uniref:phosphoenolpyruvate--glycerone phosphotransferase n=1 Tax=Oceanobacillus zhaokaii TaxID=2052660 RepID=A0A345PJ03_9BACI|nr:dihydroxyacetone kinase phosphoryl donor subunit DhaM [Oceanobacillus zhaokaii]AXI09983.1 PTS mannose transporter subunit IID [Oceanobacillus zhaokaii]QGS69162.1 PTS-dependent dihydroxyacetone kinase phosphotransferase subunit DhaM [Oceanobacillus sp. 143]